MMRLGLRNRQHLIPALLLVLLGLSSQPSQAQTDTALLDSDALFKLGRNEAFYGERKKAQVILRAALAKSPEYQEIKIFLARTYAWDGQRDSARYYLAEVLRAEPANTEALVALIDVENWDEKYQISLDLCLGGLERQKTNTDLLYRKARAEANLLQQQTAMSSLRQLLLIDPAHKEGLQLLESLKTSVQKNNISVNYAQDRFERVFDPAHYAYLQYGRRTKLGSAFLRYNYAGRFEKSGHQLEADWYPNLFKGVYAYLNAGFSGTDLFPNSRFGAEVYTKLPKAFEASAGLRQLQFGRGSDGSVILYTGTIGKYIGNYWLNVRTFITPGDAGTSNSYIFLARRYLNTAEDFIGLSGGFGFSPDFSNQTVSNTSEERQVVTLNSRRFALTLQHTLGPKWLFNVTLNYQRQAYVFDPNELISLYGVNLVLEYRW
ncbi:MAG TPA: YaiO family outer membrane beta-barrel protein [Luteibaculaceae bacterium]|nr:YaiO family outer membrane beta-barrel protein [Luteibaculaceae bacterium]